jgi:hypothetical protein
VQPLSATVYQILAVPQAGGGFLPALRRAVESDDVTAADLDELASKILHGGPADELSRAVLQAIDLENPLHYQENPTWHFGTYLARQRISKSLAAHAKDLADLDPPQAKVCARAVVLLAAQESSFFGASGLGRLLSDNRLLQVARLDERQVARLRRHIDDHLRVSNVFMVQRLRAERAIGNLKHEPSSAKELTEALNAMDLAASLAQERPDIQWEIASLTIRLRSVAPESVSSVAERASRWRTFVNHPMFDAWLDQAFAEHEVQANGRSMRVFRPTDIQHVRTQ